MSRRNSYRTRAMLLERFARPPAPVRAQPTPVVGLQPDQLVDLSMCHNMNLDAIATGQAEPDMLWDYVGTVLTWWKAAQLIEAGVPEMDLQLEVATRLVERFGRTNRVRFDGPDLQLARDGVVVMDMLAAEVSQATALAAAQWSEREVARLARACVQWAAEQQQAGASA